MRTTIDPDDPVKLLAEIARLNAVIADVLRDNNSYYADNQRLFGDLARADAREKALKDIVTALEDEVDDLRMVARGVRPGLSRDYSKVPA